MTFHKLNKRYVSLLEVLIALAIIVMCIFPLIAPHVAIFKDQASFINQIDLDHRISVLYADIYQKLQENQIPWSAIEQKQPFPVDLTQGANPLPYKGQYQFSIQKSKPPQPSQITHYLVNLVFTFTNVNELSKQRSSSVKVPVYEAVYTIYIARNPGGLSSLSTQNKAEAALSPSPKP